MLDCSPLRFMPLSKMPQTDAVAEAAPQGMPPPVWVALDEVWDPVGGLCCRPSAGQGAPSLASQQGAIAPLTFHTKRRTALPCCEPACCRLARGSLSLTSLATPVCLQQNFGAILRSAWCLGAAGLIVSSKNCAPLSPAVSKASAGAMEAAEVHSVHSMQNTLQVCACGHVLRMYSVLCNLRCRRVWPLY